MQIYASDFVFISTAFAIALSFMMAVALWMFP